MFKKLKNKRWVLGLEDEFCPPEAGGQNAIILSSTIGFR